ncbi:inhibitor of vertebrate lysozyme family protein [Pseudomonas sp. LD120]|uniref:inhibitor of vertebrate lysozyme family protein n=1 Tax=Pseudomonas sp. LD120 TaxID=485751 RepID=UPI00135AD475|nr:inhibitor of vertebrate lysozyme family protein [Pseudomonas sp. LD120]KAF0861904.1 hypothetical protein PLD_14465 [Pseudomonas sp. LD120]
MSLSLKTWAATLLLGVSTLASAANDGQARANQLLSSDEQFRETWKGVVHKEERLPDWVMNLSGAAQQMTAVEEDGERYLVGPLCETAQSCQHQRLIVAFSFDKEHAYAMLVEVPAGLPVDKSPTRHAHYRFLGEPDDGMQALLKEQLRKAPNWY